MHTPKIESASYIWLGLVPLQRERIIAEVIARLTGTNGDEPVEFDAVAFRGLSGALIAPIIAWEMDKMVIAVRKRTCEDDYYCHSARRVEGDIGARTYVIIDDCISSGATVRAIIADIKAAAPGAKCVGVLQYNSACGFDTIEELKGRGAIL